MKNLKIRTKLIIGFALPLLAILINFFSGTLTSMGVIGMEWITIGISALAFVVTIFMAWSLIRTIRMSIEQLSEGAKQIALGHTDIELVKYNDDEFSVLIDEYNNMVENIKYQAGVAQEVASGNLTVNVVPKSREDLLGNSLKKLVEDNGRTLGNIKDAAYQVSTSASQVASASQSLAQGSTEQASAIQQITASIDEIADKTRQNASEANQAAELVELAIADVKLGNGQMQDMMEAMEEINRASESISKIIKVIDDIAFQTNILALNAAVEAARAGDAGKGFAVVAEEVRSLAAKSAAAASETAELIENSIKKVDAGSKIAGDTAKALEEITNVVEKSEVIIHQIAESSNDQATAIGQIEQAIGQVSQVVQTNSATSQQCAAASEELSNQANRMKEELSVYTLETSVADTFAAKNNNTYTNGYANVPSMANINEQIISLGDGFGKY